MKTRIVFKDSFLLGLLILLFGIGMGGCKPFCTLQVLNKGTQAIFLEKDCGYQDISDRKLFYMDKVQRCLIKYMKTNNLSIKKGQYEVPIIISHADERCYIKVFKRTFRFVKNRRR